MRSYKIEAYAADGSLVFGATLRAMDDEDARQRFAVFPLNGHAAELWARDTLLGRRGAQARRRQG